MSGHHSQLAAVKINFPIFCTKVQKAKMCIKFMKELLHVYSWILWCLIPTGAAGAKWLHLRNGNIWSFPQIRQRSAHGPCQVCAGYFASENVRASMLVHAAQHWRSLLAHPTLPRPCPFLPSPRPQRAHHQQWLNLPATGFVDLSGALGPGAGLLLKPYLTAFLWYQRWW